MVAKILKTLREHSVTELLNTIREHMVANYIDI